MCGIAGIIGRLDEPNRTALARMNDAMLHRGPDAGGTWESEADSRSWGALLAHRRTPSSLVPRFRSSPDTAARSMRTSETKEH